TSMCTSRRHVRLAGTVRTPAELPSDQARAPLVDRSSRDAAIGRVCLTSLNPAGLPFPARGDQQAGDVMYATAQPLAPHSAILAPRSASSTSEFIRDLMTAHGPSVLASVTRMVRDRALAEDIVQETLVRAWRNIDRFDPDRDTGMRSWMLRVARNIAVDKFRAKKVRPVEVVESAAQAIGVAAPSPGPPRAP